MKILRTDEKHFQGLPDYPFEPHYYELKEGIRLHYVDAGPQDAKPVLMLHGEPSWSYLYRHMIPPVADAGHRVLAPDLVGFGKSDKPAHIDDYSYARHLDWLREWMEGLDLNNITLVCQDWGSLLGLRLAAEHGERFDRIIIGNGMLPTGEENIPPVFQAWKAFSLYSPIFPIGHILQLGTARKLSKDEVRAYQAPFPNRHYKAGARAFPKLVPTSPDNPETENNKRAWEQLKQWQKPFITCFSNGDPITRGGDRFMQKRIPGAQGQPHVTLKGGHFLQEDSPRDFAQVILDALAAAEAAEPAAAEAH
ncbi:haloalkane dehalogenase [Marinobacteraceae bacterium S3BR75-40.1]